MPTAWIIFGLFVALVTMLVFVYERPKSRRRKITGRGGDFAE